MNGTTRWPAERGPVWWTRPSLVLIGVVLAGGCRAPKEPAAPGQAPAGGPVAGGAALDPNAITQAAGTAATLGPDGVVRMTWARTDIQVVVDGVRLTPPAGLSSWAGLAPGSSGAVLMGDTVVLEDEVDAAMDAAFANGIEVTALHNHFLFDQPRVLFLHVGGRGDAAALARGVKAIWEAVRAVRERSPRPAGGFAGPSPGPAGPGALDSARIADLAGHPATVSGGGGVVKITIAREGTAGGVPVGGSMGLTTWAAFSGSDRLAAMDGDFIMAAGEVQPVLRALRAAGIHVVALHHHMVEVEPALFFTHFWGKGTAEALASGFRSALDAQARISGPGSP